MGLAGSTLTVGLSAPSPFGSATRTPFVYEGYCSLWMISRIALDAKGVTPGDPEVDHRIRPRLTNQSRYFLRCLPNPDAA